MASSDPAPTRNRGLTLAFLCSGIVMVYVDLTVVNVALPAIQRSLNADISQLQWIVDAYALVLACLLLTAGTLGDVLGRKRIFLGGLAGFTAASVLCAVSPDYGFLLVARVLQGAAGSVMIPLSLALVATIFPEPAARARAIGVWAGVGGLAMAAGPVIGGALVDAFGWQVIFWINAPLGVLAFAFLYKLLPPARPAAARRPDLLGQVLFVLAMVAVVYGLIDSSDRGWSSPVIIGSMALGGVLLLGFIAWELRAPDPMLPMGVWRNPVMVMAALVNFFGLFGLFTTIFLLTLYLQDVNGLSTVTAGSRFLALNIAVMVFSYLASVIAAKLGPRIPIVVGSLMSAVGLYHFISLQPGATFGSYWWALALIGSGVSLVGAPATVALLGAVRPEQAGTATGVSNTFRQVGSVFGVAIGGTLLVEHLANATPAALASVPLGGQRASVVSGISHGDLSVVDKLPADLHRQVIDAVGPAVTDGIHLGMATAALGSLIGALFALLLLRKRPAAAPAAPAPAGERPLAEHAASEHADGGLVL